MIHNIIHIKPSPCIPSPLPAFSPETPKSTNQPVHVADLVMQCEEGHGGIDGLSALGRQPHHPQPTLVQLLRQLVDGNVGRRTHQHGAATRLHQVVHNCCRGDSLAGTGWTLNVDGELKKRFVHTY